MKKEFDEALCHDFPLLFKDRDSDMRTTAMCWGFPGDGWEPLIRRLARKIEVAIQEGISAGRWSEDNHPRASQVKEKYGGLRFYMTHTSDEIEDLIQVAEVEADKTCEWCGEPGTLRNGGWMVTLCDKHNEDRMNI